MELGGEVETTHGAGCSHVLALSAFLSTSSAGPASFLVISLQMRVEEPSRKMFSLPQSACPTHPPQTDQSGSPLRQTSIMPAGETAAAPFPTLTPGHREGRGPSPPQGLLGRVPSPLLPRVGQGDILTSHVMCVEIWHHFGLSAPSPAKPQRQHLQNQPSRSGLRHPEERITSGHWGTEKPRPQVFPLSSKASQACS